MAAKKLDLRKLIEAARSGKSGDGRLTPQQALAEALKPRTAPGRNASPTVNPRLTRSPWEHGFTEEELSYLSPAERAVLAGETPANPIAAGPLYSNRITEEDILPPPRQPIGAPVQAAAQAGAQSYVQNQATGALQDKLFPTSTPVPPYTPVSAAPTPGLASSVSNNFGSALGGARAELANVPKGLSSITQNFWLPKAASTAPATTTGVGPFASGQAYGSTLGTSGVGPFSSGQAYSSALAGSTPSLSPFALSGIGSAGNAYLPAAGAYGAHDLFSRPGRGMSETRGALQGGASGAALGSYFGPIGAIVGGVLGTGVGLAKTLGKSNRHKDDYKRRGQFEELRKAGLLGENNTLELSTGEKRRLDFDKKAYNVNFDQPGVGDIVAAVNPLAEIISGGDKKIRSDFAGYFTNAIANSTDPTAEARNVYQRAGLDQETAASEINRLHQSGAFDEATRDVYLGTLPRVFGTAPAPAPAAPAAAKKTSSGSSKREESPPSPSPTPTPLPPLTAPLTPAVVQPALRSPQDFADAITGVYQQNYLNRPRINPNPYPWTGLQ